MSRRLSPRRLPFGAFPSPAQGYYRRHRDFVQRYHDETRTVEGNRGWLERWVLGVDDWTGFLDRIGPEVLEQVRIRQHLLSGLWITERNPMTTHAPWSQAIDRMLVRAQDTAA